MGFAMVMIPTPNDYFSAAPLEQRGKARLPRERGRRWPEIKASAGCNCTPLAEAQAA